MVLTRKLVCGPVSNPMLLLASKLALLLYYVGDEGSAAMEVGRVETEAFLPCHDGAEHKQLWHVGDHGALPSQEDDSDMDTSLIRIDDQRPSTSSARRGSIKRWKILVGVPMAIAALASAKTFLPQVTFLSPEDDGDARTPSSVWGGEQGDTTAFGKKFLDGNFHADGNVVATKKVGQENGGSGTYQRDGDEISKTKIGQQNNGGGDSSFHATHYEQKFLNGNFHTPGSVHAKEKIGQKNAGDGTYHEGGDTRTKTDIGQQNNVEQKFPQGKLDLNALQEKFLDGNFHADGNVVAEKKVGQVNGGSGTYQRDGNHVSKTRIGQQNNVEQKFPQGKLDLNALQEKFLDGNFHADGDVDAKKVIGQENGGSGTYQRDGDRVSKTKIGQQNNGDSDSSFSATHYEQKFSLPKSIHGHGDASHDKHNVGEQTIGYQGKFETGTSIDLGAVQGKFFVPDVSVTAPIHGNGDESHNGDENHIGKQTIGQQNNIGDNARIGSINYSSGTNNLQQKFFLPGKGDSTDGIKVSVPIHGNGDESHNGDENHIDKQTIGQQNSLGNNAQVGSIGYQGKFESPAVGAGALRQKIQGKFLNGNYHVGGTVTKTTEIGQQNLGDGSRINGVNKALAPSGNAAAAGQTQPAAPGVSPSKPPAPTAPVPTKKPAGGSPPAGVVPGTPPVQVNKPVQGNKPPVAPGQGGNKAVKNPVAGGAAANGQAAPVSPPNAAPHGPVNPPVNPPPNGNRPPVKQVGQQGQPLGPQVKVGQQNVVTGGTTVDKIEFNPRLL